MYKYWIKKSNDNSSIILTWLYSQRYKQHLRIFNVVALPIYYLFPNVWMTSYTIIVSIFVDVPYRPAYSTNKFISYVVPGPSQWVFNFGEEIVIAWTHIGWVRWMFQNLTLPEARDRNSGVTPCIVMNNVVLYHLVSFSPQRWTKVLLQEPLRGTRYNTTDKRIRAIRQRCPWEQLRSFARSVRVDWKGMGARG